MQNQHVVVTGGTGALGQAVVARLLSDGAHCHIPCHDVEPSAGSAHLDHPRVTLQTGIDLAKEAAVRDYYASLPPIWASLHIAGGFAMAALADTTLADFEAMWRMNTVTCFLCCREAAARMRATGQGGRLLNVAARPALEPTGGKVAYTTSKAAVASLTECLARELAPDRIWVNALVPSIIDTPSNRAAMPKAKHDLWPKPIEIAEVAAFVVSSANEVTTGNLIPVYGKTI